MNEFVTAAFYDELTKIAGKKRAAGAVLAAIGVGAKNSAAAVVPDAAAAVKAAAKARRAAAKAAKVNAPAAVPAAAPAAVPAAPAAPAAQASSGGASGLYDKFKELDWKQTAGLGAGVGALGVGAFALGSSGRRSGHSDGRVLVVR